MALSWLIIGVLAVGCWHFGTELLYTGDKIHKLEADVRKYSGKYLDLQEQQQDIIRDIEAHASVLSYELEQCRQAQSGKK